MQKELAPEAWQAEAEPAACVLMASISNAKTKIPKALEINGSELWNKPTKEDVSKVSNLFSIRY